MSATIAPPCNVVQLGTGANCTTRSSPHVQLGTDAFYTASRAGSLLYMISVAAELTGMHPQTLRVYESKGLVNPKRSGGNTRLYSQADIERLELINQLTDEGINLAGVVRILDMKERAEARELEAEKLRSRVRQLEDELHELKMQKRITALAPRDGSADPEKVLRGLLGGGDL